MTGIFTIIKIAIFPELMSGFNAIVIKISGYFLKKLTR